MKTLEYSVSNTAISTFSFSVNDEIQSVLVDSFTRWIKNLLSEKNSIINGLELMYGWTSIQCHIDQTHLTFKAPDQEQLPIVWTDDLTKALESIAFHQFVPESFGLDFDIPSLYDTVMVSANYQNLPMFMTRSEKNSDDDSHSGWFIANTSANTDISDENTLKFMTIYEVVVNAPHTYKYISMPCGSQVIFDTQKPDFLYKNEPIRAVENSIVAVDLEPA